MIYIDDNNHFTLRQKKYITNILKLARMNYHPMSLIIFGELKYKQILIISKSYLMLLFEKHYYL